MRCNGYQDSHEMTPQAGEWAWNAINKSYLSFLTIVRDLKVLFTNIVVNKFLFSSSNIHSRVQFLIIAGV